MSVIETGGLPENLLAQLSTHKSRRSWKRDLFVKIAKEKDGCVDLDDLLIGYWKSKNEVLLRSSVKTFMHSMVMQGYFVKTGNDSYSLTGKGDKS